MGVIDELIGMVEDIITAHVASVKIDILTTYGGRVKTYDHNKKRANLIAMSRRAIPNEAGELAYEELPEMPNVPIIFPRGGGNAITWPLQAGDKVVIFACSINDRRALATPSDKPEDAGDSRMHHPAYVYAIPGIWGDLEPEAEEGPGITLTTPTEIRLGGVSATTEIPLAPPVMANFDAIKNAVAAIPAPVDPSAAAAVAAVQGAFASISYQDINSTKVRGQ